MTSHLLADVEDVCDRIAILHLGTLRKLGEVKELLRLKDILQIRVRNLSEEGRDRVAALIAEKGAELLEVNHPSETLEALFLKTIREHPAEEDRESHRA